MFHSQHHPTAENNDSGKDGHYNMQVYSKNPHMMFTVIGKTGKNELN